MIFNFLTKRANGPFLFFKELKFLPILLNKKFLKTDKYIIDITTLLSIIRINTYESKTPANLGNPFYRLMELNNIIQLYLLEELLL